MPHRLLLVLWLGFTAAPLASAESSAPRELADAFAAVSRPGVGAPLAPPADRLRIGRAELRLAAGGALRPLLAQGRICGFLVDGPATLVYHLEDRFSVPVALRNLKHVSGLRAEREGTGLRWTIALSGAAVWGFDLPEMAAGGAAGPTGALPDWLAEVLRTKLIPNPERDLLVADRNGEPGYRWGVFHAPREDYVLDVDPRRAVATESFARLRRLESDDRIHRGRLDSETISAQPIGNDWWDTRPLDLVTTETEIELVNDRGLHATIDSKLRVRALRDGLRLLPFTLLNEFADDNGHQRKLELSSVSVDGAAADFVRSRGQLLVRLPAALPRGGEVTVEVHTAGDVLARPEGNNYWILRTQAWYPKLGAIGDEFSTFKISVESAAPFVPITAGEVVRREQTPLGERVLTTLDVPMERVPAVAGVYRTYDREHEGSRLHVSSYANAKPEESERLAGIVLGVRSCLERWLGVPSPFQDFQLVEVQDWGWGQAPPGVIFITREAFLSPMRAHRDEETERMAARYTRGINERLAHEVAHTWFPHVAKVHRDEERWLSESLAEYASIECLVRSLKDREQADYFLRRKLADWKQEAREIGDGGSIFLAGYLSGERDSDALAYRHLLYAKGPLVLHAVRQKLMLDQGAVAGEKMFLTWLRSYVKNFTYQAAETRHLVGILSQLTGRDWQPWFERFVYGTETPELD